MIKIITNTDDTLDQIAKKHYGDERFVVEILDANPELITAPVYLPSGIFVNLPNYSQPATQKPIGAKLWSE